jgi:hypothetical protein
VTTRRTIPRGALLRISRTVVSQFLGCERSRRVLRYALELILHRFRVNLACEQQADFFGRRHCEHERTATLVGYWPRGTWLTLQERFGFVRRQRRRGR